MTGWIVLAVALLTALVVGVLFAKAWRRAAERIDRIYLEEFGQRDELPSERDTGGAS